MKPMRALMLAALPVLVFAPPATAGVSVGFDVETLNELLPALSASAISVPITESQTVNVFLEEMRVTGLEPTAGGSGHILTSMRVRVPRLGIDLPVSPRLSLHATEDRSGSLLELRFEEVRVALPLAGAIDIAPLMPPLRFPAENVFVVAGAVGDVEVRSRLREIQMGQRVVRLEFELDTLPD
jgi:hypothetical protein